MTRHAVVWCVNTVLLSESIYTRFSLHITQNFVYYTKGNPKSLSHSGGSSVGWSA